MNLNRRSLLTLLGAGFGVTSLGAIARSQTPSRSQAPLKVGILHSISGSMAIVEKSVVDAELLAIDEINKAGGVLGRRIEPVIADAKSDWMKFAEQAKKLIDQDRVATIFGCWASASRRACLPVIEERNHLLWYPMTYEGQECSKNLLYMGSVPNQQIETTLNWIIKTFPKKPIFLLGSDYVYPRTINAVIKSQIGATSITGEAYVPLGDVDSLQSILHLIERRMPNGGVIFNSLIGDSNIAFFKQLPILELPAQSPKRKRYPTVSVSLMEEEILAIGTEYLTDHYIAQSYFQSVNTPENRRFVKAFKARYGPDRVINDPMAAAYTAVYLWKQAVEKAGTAENLDKVRQVAQGMTVTAPEGQIRMNSNHHMSRFARVGRIRPDGQLDIVNQSQTAIAPQPWNQMISATKGYLCDWSTNRGGKFRI